MPLVNPKDDLVDAPKPTPVIIAKPEYKGVTVDTKMIPVSSLLSHVEGSSWIVNYYSQVLNKDNASAGQGLGTNPIHQQYRLINSMELKVTSPLSNSQDPESKSMVVTGSATLYPFIIPNEGDIFLADIGSGREGVFQITNVTRLSISTQTCHTIDYNLIDYSNTTRRTDLALKVVQTFYYQKDFLLHGQNPLLFEEDYVVVKNLQNSYRHICDSYFRTFFSREYSILLVPLQSTPTYDHYHTEALLRNFSTWDSEEIRYIRKLNVDDDSVMRATQIWDVIFTKNISLLNNCFTKVGKVYSSQFSSEPLHEGVRYSGVKELMYPLDPTVTVDFGYTPVVKTVNGTAINIPNTSLKTAGGYLAQLRPKTLEDVIDRTLAGFDQIGDKAIYNQSPLIHPVLIDNYYVFSRAFYENDQLPGKQSVLEVLTRQYIGGKDLDIQAIKRLVDNIPQWNPLDQFYYIPIILFLIKSIIRSV